MAISGTMTIWGLYKYDPSIFDNFSLPSSLVKQDIIDEILLDGASLEILYPQPDFLKAAIGVWSNHRKPIWDKMVESTQFEYEPMYNLDRTDEQTETTTGEDSRTRERTTSTTGSSTGSSTSETDTSGTSTSIGARTGYNSNDFADTDKQTRTGSDESSTTNSSSTTDSSSGTDSEEESGTNEVTITRTYHSYGNIGVTSNATLLTEHRQVINYDVSEIIVHEFLDKFTLGIY